MPPGNMPTEQDGVTVRISQKLVAVNAASSVLTHILNTLILIWLQPFLLHRVAIEEYALYPVVMAPMAFIPLISTVLTGGLGRYIVEARARGDDQRITDIVSSLFPVLAVAGTALLALGALFVWQIDRLLEIPPPFLADARLMAAVLVLGAALRIVAASFETGLYVQQKFLLINAVQFATQLLRLGLLLGLLVGIAPRVLYVVVATVGAESVNLLVTVFISRRLVPAITYRRRRFRRGIVKELVSFGSWTFVQQLSAAVTAGAIPIMLNRLSTALDVSCYYLGYLVLSQLRYLIAMATRPLEPPLVALYTWGNRAVLGRIYLRGGRYALWLGTLVAGPVIVYRRELITLYVGDTMQGAGTVMMILLFSVPFTFPNIMLGKLAPAMAEIRPLARQVAINQALVLLLSLVYVGVFDLGAVGAAAAYLSMVLAIHPVRMWVMGRRLAGVSLGQWLSDTIRPGLLPLVIGLPVWVWMHLVAAPSTWPALAACTLAGTVAFLAGLLAFCLSAEERRWLVDGVSRTWRPSASSSGPRSGSK